MQETNVKKKKRMWLKCLIFLFLIITFLGVYICKIEINLINIWEQSIIDEDLPLAYNGLKITHFSDIHFGRTIFNDNLTNIVNKINELNSDVVIFTGDLLDDFINISDDDIAKLIENLKNIQAKYRKYAILGDMDYLNKNLYCQIMQEANFQVLDNQSDLLYVKDNQPIEFIGISSLLEMQDDISKAMDKDITNSNFKILMAHEPIILDSITDYNINIVLTGHSLGGLISIGNHPLLKLDGVNNYLKGKITKDNTVMYVNTGLGTSKLNIRFLNKPTINFYRLYNN